MGPICLGANESHIYPNMCAIFGYGPTVVSREKGGTDKGPARAGPRPAGRAGPQPMGRAGPGFNDILRAGPGGGLKLAGPGRARAGK